MTDGGPGEPGLSAVEPNYAALVAGTSDVIAVVASDGTIRYVSPAAVDVLGHRPDQLVGRLALDVIHPDDVRAMLTQFVRPMAREPSSTERLSFRAAHADGGWRWVEAAVRNLVHEPTVEGLVVSLRDVTAQRRAEAMQSGRSRILDLVARAAPLGETLDELARLAEDHMPGALVSVMLVDPTGAVLVPTAGPSLPAAVIVALSTGVPIGHQLESGACGAAAFERRLVVVSDVATDPMFSVWRQLALDNGLLACWSMPISSSDGQVIGTFATYYAEARGPTESEVFTLAAFGELAGIAVERKQTEDRLAHRALHDPLTGLPNRDLFLDRLAHALGQLDRLGGMVAVLFCDLDGFKAINDRLGHDIGDAVLVAAAQRLQAGLRAGDTAARFGGDEFVVLCESVQSEHHLVVLAERVGATVAAPLGSDSEELSVTCSIGISVARSGHVDPELLVREADTAMYQAKRRGKARFELFDDEMRRNVLSRIQVEDTLRAAVARNQLIVQYQPEMSLADGSVVGIESLVRWQHPHRGLVGPEEFLSVAAETSLIFAIGEFVVGEVCRQAQSWHDLLAGRPPLALWVKLSNRELRHPDLARMVAAALADSQVEAGRLGFEISESALMEDAEATIVVLHELRRLGVRLGIDAFGVGYSSLTYLRRFPVDRLKIDRSFVSRLADIGPSGVAGDEGAMVDAIVGLAHLLGLWVVADGVETTAELDRLRFLGCDAAEGRLLAPPGPAHDMTSLLTG